jgi:hypothetical protein
MVVGLLLAMACGSDFDPASQVKTLRIVAVEADRNYVLAGDGVTLTMTYADGAPAGSRAVQVTWFKACENPPGASYLGCLASLAIDKTEILGTDKSGVIGSATFALTVSRDVVERATSGASGPRYGTSFIFFAICAGTMRAANPDEGSQGLAFGCFDDKGVRLGAEAFVPGYTQLYAFEDRRTNVNPANRGLTIDGDRADPTVVPSVATCSTQDTSQPQGCGPPPQNQTACTKPTIDVVVDDVAELDGSLSASGTPQREVVWVDYFADKGTFEKDRKVVSKADTGIVSDHGVEWTPPKEAGDVHFWAVVHDSRGGISVARRTLHVQ